MTTNSTCTEINMRLDVAGRSFTDSEFRQREQIVVTMLKQFGQVEHRTRTLWKGPLIRFVARVQGETIPHEDLYHLAALMLQDCLTGFYPARNEGFLIGPQSAKWKGFNLYQFDRYDESLSLMKSGEFAYGRTKYVPHADPAVVKQQMEAMYARVRQVFSESVLASFAHQQVNMTNGAINRVLEYDGPDALTIPRLEGIHELVTEHLWCDALTVAVATRDQGKLT